jgi:hypothetical protein
MTKPYSKIPKSPAWFKKHRIEQYEAVEDYQETQRVIVEAQIKTGKKELVLIETVLRKGVGSEGLNSRFMYITSLHKKDTQPQLAELKTYGINSFVLTAEDDIDMITDEILPCLKDEKVCLTIYVDEGDYGSEKDQLLQKFFLRISEEIYAIERHSGSKNKVFLRFYTATPEELTFSEYASQCCRHYYVPPASNYRGAERLLHNNLVVEAQPFFEFDAHKNIKLSQQALQMLNNWSACDKPFSIVRVSGKRKELPTFKQVCQDIDLRLYLRDQFNVKIVEVDQTHPRVWGDDEGDGKPHILDYVGHEYKVIYLINQTCTRSTEIKCHPLIYAFHDYHSKSTAYNTYVQSSLRIAHYEYTGEFKYGKSILWNDNPSGDGVTIVPINSDIILYSNINCIRLHAKNSSYSISYEEFRSLESTRKLSGRTSKSVNFKPTDDMLKNRTIEFLPIPDNILNDALANYDPQKLKQQYPVIHDWLEYGQDESAVRVRKEFFRSYSKLARRNDIFYRSLGANKAVSLAKALINLTHHTAMAPIFIDRHDPNYKEDFDNLLKEHKDCLHKMALMILSDEEIDARERHIKTECTGKNSIYQSKVLQTV